MATKTSSYWTSNNGAVACEKHLGYSASAELQANPKARTLYGACDTWHKMTKADLAEWLVFLEGHGLTEACEFCRNHSI